MTSLRTPLVSPEELAASIAAGRSPVILDASFDLADTDAGERQFAAGHVPGSRYVHLDRDLAGTKNGRNGRHPLPDRAAFARTVGQLGIRPDTPVVVLDAQGGVYAARLWWMLRWLGHEAVAVLDGGLQAWKQAGGALSTQAGPVAEAPAYPERPSLAPMVGSDEVAGRPASATVVDARAPERFRGETEPLDRVAGHIPGALNRFFKANLDARGRFRPADELRRELASLLGTRAPADVIHSCGSGVTACHNLLAMEHAGLGGSALYPGSWSEWSSDPARPVATG
jgi:thiosulfate/3-mercaptopyruvate sulfurtransferase